MFYLPQRVLVLALLGLVSGATGLPGATLEKLSVEDMSRKSTAVVRGKVGACQGEQQGSVIQTRCSLQVSEVWKGSLPGPVFYLPGGQANGLIQNFAGVPKVAEGQEYVLFLWTGKSGKPQVIGLSQGLFNLSADTKGGEARVRRAATTELLLDSNGVPASDTAIDLSVSQLKLRVLKALAEVRQ